jgi:hypothetical protein
VPRLRDLPGFEVVESVAEQRTWQMPHAFLLVGAVVAVGAAFAAWLLASFDGGVSRHLPDDRGIREAFESADAVQIYKAWSALKRSGVDRGAMPAELFLRRVSDSVGRVVLFLWVVAAAGCLAALGGGIASVSRTTPAKSLPAGVPKS